MTEKRSILHFRGVLRIYRFILHCLLVEISPKHGWALLRPTVISPPPRQHICTQANKCRQWTIVIQWLSCIPYRTTSCYLQADAFMVTINKQTAIIGLFEAELKTMIYKGRLRNDNDHEEQDGGLKWHFPRETELKTSKGCAPIVGHKHCLDQGWKKYENRRKRREKIVRRKRYITAKGQWQ